jgi:hypothetical protein
MCPPTPKDSSCCCTIAQATSIPGSPARNNRCSRATSSLPVHGVAALDSVNRTTGAWAAQAALANNLDAGNVAAALDRLAKDGTFAATKPVFLLGFSAGADAAARYAEMLASATPARPIKGTVLYCATGGATLAITSKVPQFFALAANDEVLGTAGNTTARDNAQYLAGRGIASAILSSNPAPVYNGRFTSLALTTPAFSAADATAVWNAVKAAGFLDDNNYVKDTPTLDAVRTALPTNYQSRAADVLAQLAIAAATQEFYSEANSRVIAFLAARVAGTPAPRPADSSTCPLAQKFRSSAIPSRSASISRVPKSHAPHPRNRSSPCQVRLALRPPRPAPQRSTRAQTSSRPTRAGTKEVTPPPSLPLPPTSARSPSRPAMPTPPYCSPLIPARTPRPSAASTARSVMCSPKSTTSAKTELG